MSAMLRKYRVPGRRGNLQAKLAEMMRVDNGREYFNKRDADAFLKFLGEEIGRRARTNTSVLIPGIGTLTMRVGPEHVVGAEKKRRLFLRLKACKSLRETLLEGLGAAAEAEEARARVYGPPAGKAGTSGNEADREPEDGGDHSK